MCRKDTKDCKAKIKCKVCKVLLDNSENHDKISLDEVDSKFELNQYVIETKGDIK